jgi:hypothetical protein
MKIWRNPIRKGFGDEVLVRHIVDTFQCDNKIPLY